MKPKMAQALGTYSTVIDGKDVGSMRRTHNWKNKLSHIHQQYKGHFGAGGQRIMAVNVDSDDRV